MNNKSPLRYPGGKSRACKIIDNILNNNYDPIEYTTLISPFFGGGSVEFYLQNKYNYTIIANDKFEPLYNFWMQSKTNNANLCNELEKIPDISKEDFITYRNNIVNCNDCLLKAVYYFVINRCSFSGATLSGGFSLEASKKRYTSSSINRIKDLDMSNIMLYNLDFSNFINDINNDNAFIFLDPPYYLEKSNLYGYNGDMHEHFDHNNLYDIIKNKKNWLMTYNNCDYIRNIYKEYTIIEAEWSYSMNKSKKSSEIIILSIKNNI